MGVKLLTMAGHRDDGSYHEDNAHHPRRKVSKEESLKNMYADYEYQRYLNEKAELHDRHSDYFDALYDSYPDYDPSKED